MKKLILSVTAVAGFSMAAFAQGTITFDGSTGGHITINGVADTTQDVNAELLYSSTGAAGTFNPLITMLLSSSATASGPAAGQVITAAGDISFNGDGSLYDSGGQAYIIPAIASGVTAFFEVEAWTGNNVNSYPAAGTPGTYGQSAIFSEVLTAASSPSQANIGAMTGINLVTVAVPEPSTLAMAGVGLASMLFLRRKNK